MTNAHVETPTLEKLSDKERVGITLLGQGSRSIFVNPVLQLVLNKLVLVFFQSNFKPLIFQIYFRWE